MKNKLYNLYTKHNVLVKNFNYLSIIQVVTLLVPFLVYPYLIRVLGKELYGVYAYSFAFIAFFVMFINFGFDISELKSISINRDQKEKVSEIFSSVLISKFILALISFLIICLIAFFTNIFGQHVILYFSFSGFLLDAVINPTFYFQGIEKMKYMTLLTLISKLIYLSLIFVLVKTSQDYFLVPLIMGLGMLIADMAGLFIIFNKHDIKFKVQSFYKLKETYKESFPFFSSRISVLINTQTNVLLLGAFVGYVEVAYYDLAKKVVTLLKTPYNIANQTIFPNVSKTKNIIFVLKVLKILFLIYVLIILLVFVFDVFVIKILGGEELLKSEPILNILSFSLITELIAVFTGAPMLLVAGYKKEYNMSLVYGTIFYLILVLLLYLFNCLGLYQLTILTVLTSFFLMIIRLKYCHKYNLINFKILKL